MATPESRSNHRSQNSIRASGSKKSAALATLKAYESVCIASVLEDCADQLAILGAIMPGSYEARKDAKQVTTILKLSCFVFCFLVASTFSYIKKLTCHRLAMSLSPNHLLFYFNFSPTLNQYQCNIYTFVLYNNLK